MGSPELLGCARKKNVWLIEPTKCAAPLPAGGGGWRHTQIKTDEEDPFPRPQKAKAAWEKPTHVLSSRRPFLFFSDVGQADKKTLPVSLTILSCLPLPHKGRKLKDIHILLKQILLFSKKGWHLSSENSTFLAKVNGRQPTSLTPMFQWGFHSRTKGPQMGNFRSIFVFNQNLV